LEEASKTHPELLAAEYGGKEGRREGGREGGREGRRCSSR